MFLWGVNYGQLFLLFQLGVLVIVLVSTKWLATKDHNLWRIKLLIFSPLRLQPQIRNYINRIKQITLYITHYNKLLKNKNKNKKREKYFPPQLYLDVIDILHLSCTVWWFMRKILPPRRKDTYILFYWRVVNLKCVGFWYTPKWFGVYPSIMVCSKILDISELHVVVQLLSHVWLFVTPWTASHQVFLSFIISQSLLKLLSVESVTPTNYLIFGHPLLLLPSIFLSIRIFSNELVLCIRWPNYGSFSFSISHSNEYLGLASFRIDWFDLAVQGTLRSLLQHHSSKAPIPWRSAFFMVQLSHPYMTTGKSIAFTLWTFVGKVLGFLICCLGLS